MPVLERISLTVRAGEFVSIVGPSGSGKSTLLDIIAGLTVPDTGRVRIDGNDTTAMRGYAAYMPQKDVLLPWRKIVDNVALPLEIAGIGKKEARREAEKWLPAFGLGEFAASYPHELSGGMRQRAAFLRTCLCQKELMLLDEPFGSLDALTRLDMQRWLMDVWKSFRSSVLLVTHDIDEAIFLSDHVYVFSPRPGKLAGEVVITLGRPRRVEMTTSPEFAGMKAEIMQILQNNAQVSARPSE